MVNQRHRPLHVGLILDNLENRGGKTPRWSDIVAHARLAEAVGFDSLWLSDHLIHRFDDVPDYGIWESWSMLAALAAATGRVELGNWVLCTGWRNPALLAKMADTVDEISGGRLILALGAGWHEPEYRAFGFPFDNRIARFSEAIQIIHGLLRNGRIDFAGRFYEARECELRPRGPRPQGPPIMIGTIAGSALAKRMGITSGGERMLDLVARYAELWNVPWVNDPGDLPGLRAMMTAACARAGRDPATLAQTNGVHVDLPGWQSAPGNEVIRAGRAALNPITGSPAELAESLRVYARAGVAQVHLFLDPETPAGIETLGRTLEILDRAG